MTTDVAIEVEDLRKDYGDFRAVRGISFSVRRGEIYGLLGPNGAGKTTTVEILEGYRERSAGRVAVLGMDPGSRPVALRERIGIVLQSSGLYRHLTVHEAVSHWAGLYLSPRDVEETIALSGLEAAGGQRTITLSGGQQRRLDLALALVGDPELVFLDEPTTGFDPAARRQAWETVRSLKQLGKTVLLTTHYLDEAQALADRVAIIKDGAILAEGAPGELSADAELPHRLARRDRGHARACHRGSDGAAARADRRGAGARRALARAQRRSAQPGGRVPRAHGREGRMSDHALDEPLRRARPQPASVPWRRAAWRQYRLERKMFWRNPSAAFFNFLLPLIFLALFGAIFSEDEENLQVIVPGIAGMAVMSTTFSALAMTLTYLRESGVLKRVRGTPLPTSAYLAGIAGNAITNTALQVTLITAAGSLVFGLDPPQDLVALVVFVVLGVICFASLGVALSHAIPNFDSAPAYVNAAFLPLIFISGVFYDADYAPGFLQAIAEVLPLKHLIDGLSGALVTGEGLSDNLPALALLALWSAAGVVLAVRGFSWEARRGG